ncbi:hypothetical protein HL658_00860 [Azospirillum sp. RWY-5-1]|uniref:Uncharacterized protein n=1 Tax=Azospirillum oleiclasticum TaxID=2735135 RepID=A0ABX2T6G9_9PROT|nr:hypothetical protein [Azospirillum oleiclasticum]NYZ11083.1 hypothetical protein [Azospirillum oleiclasticum]NYZ18245.1 hypothetical protein [Azospirillum oleiclasticum]
MDFGLLAIPAMAFAGLFGYSVMAGPEIIVEPIRVPHAVETQGFTSEVVSRRVVDEIATAIRRQSEAVRDMEVEKHPLEKDIDAVGHRFDVSWLVGMTRYSLGLVPHYFTGEMVMEGNEVELRLRAFLADHQRALIVTRGPVHNLGPMIQEAGREAARRMDPAARPDAPAAVASTDDEGG